MSLPEKEDWEKQLKEFETLEKVSLINLENFKSGKELCKKKIKELS